ncbi:pyruvoyl-dependent arginine decarboxylase [Candidatus Woesearchaeota archaeon]|nr:pyruvoyl-dependent arginine decarboxylase [Candidatus Woesearchaeota archaeon]MBW3005313.1 pyruvoyl-dependent arginine decarboxylase [Candidatus Woesearchaeota archaeon]
MNYEKTKDPPAIKDPPRTLVGNIVPKDFFITSGIGQSDITIHAGSFHLALKDARIERCNILTYSSILPGTANKIEFNPENLTHGAELKTIMACADVKNGERATAAVIFGWLYNKKTGEKYGGLVCEYNGSKTEEEAKDELKASLKEIYGAGYSDNFELKDVEIHSRSFVPEKKFGTALVALCFVNFEQPVLNKN